MHRFGRVHSRCSDRRVETGKSTNDEGYRYSGTQSLDRYVDLPILLSGIGVGDGCTKGDTCHSRGGAAAAGGHR